MKNQMHLKSLGIQVDSVSFDRQGIANHATNLASTIQSNLKRSLEAIGVVSCVLFQGVPATLQIRRQLASRGCCARWSEPGLGGRTTCAGHFDRQRQAPRCTHGTV